MFIGEILVGSKALSRSILQDVQVSRILTFLFSDIISEFGKIVDIITGFVVMPNHEIIGAECGSIF